MSVKSITATKEALLESTQHSSPWRESLARQNNEEWAPDTTGVIVKNNSI